MTYTIIEVANTHAGNENYILKLIDKFKEYKSDFGIKFQPLKAEEIATKDFKFFNVYEELYFNPNQWSRIIKFASETKDVWLDLFDNYGIEILNQNFENTFGIKLQVSVLFNYSIFESLKTIDLSNKKIIINVASLTFSEIQFFIDKFENEIVCDELLIEVGFQSYPTDLIDSGISKIKSIKTTFNKRVVFADHVDGKSDYAIWLPIIALNNGADVIEKHVMLEDEETKYDYFSSVTPVQFSKIIELTEDFKKLNNADFINQKEINYLQNSLLKPVLKIDKKAGSSFTIPADFDFKRSNQSGLSIKEIEQLSQSNYVLSVDKNSGETINQGDLKKATIAVVIACRLKSSRLKSKALLKIGDITSVEYCIKSAKKFKNINHVVLATSYLDSDSDLINYTYDESVIFHKGHPENVIDRYLEIVEKLNIDVIVRVTADNPFIDKDILAILLESHFKTGADYTTAKETALGVNLEIFNKNALKKINSIFPSAEYSEYMTWYFVNNPHVFNLNFVDLPSKFIRNYRLTLDFEEDLLMYNKIHSELSVKNSEFGILDVYDLLDNNPEIIINSHLNAKYRTDKELIDKLNEHTKIKF